MLIGLELHLITAFFLYFWNSFFIAVASTGSHLNSEATHSYIMIFINNKKKEKLGQPLQIKIILQFIPVERRHKSVFPQLWAGMTAFKANLTCSVVTVQFKLHSLLNISATLRLDKWKKREYWDFLDVSSGCLSNEPEDTVRKDARWPGITYVDIDELYSKKSNYEQESWLFTFLKPDIMHGGTAASLLPQNLPCFIL